MHDIPNTITVETPFGTLSLQACNRTQIRVFSEELRVNNVPYRLNHTMHLHPDGSRIGSLDTSGWQHMEVGKGWDRLYMRRTDRTIDAEPSHSAREKLLVELRKACEQFPAELLDQAEHADVESDIDRRTAQIAAAEAFIEQMRDEIAHLRAGGREVNAEVGTSRSRRPVIQMPDGTTIRTRTADFKER